MRKILSLILVVMFVLGMTTGLRAEATYNRSPDARVLTVCMAQTSTATLDSTVTAEYNRILGVTYSDSAAGYVTLADYTSATYTAASVFAEVYVAAGTTSTIMFPLPRNIASGLVYKMSTATGYLIIYYE